MPGFSQIRTFHHWSVGVSPAFAAETAALPAKMYHYPPTMN